jgi:hypothetical protein
MGAERPLDSDAELRRSAPMMACFSEEQQAAFAIASARRGGGGQQPASQADPADHVAKIPTCLGAYPLRWIEGAMMMMYLAALLPPRCQNPPWQHMAGGSPVAQVRMLQLAAAVAREVHLALPQRAAAPLRRQYQVHVGQANQAHHCAHADTPCTGTGAGAAGPTGRCSKPACCHMQLLTLPGTDKRWASACPALSWAHAAARPDG